jgi:Sulfatase
VKAALAILLAAVALAGIVLVSRPADAARDVRPPVVFVMFDALPIQLLEDGHGRIDAARFPNFAALAADGTWYRNATTISESTRYSVPAMLDGRRPQPQLAETLEDHPTNLFTLLKPSYRLNVWEEATLLCPCKPHSNADVLWRLRHGRDTRFRSAVRAISGGPPQLTFIHVLLPHEPRQYLPDGTRYRRPDGADALGGPPSYDNRFLTEQTEQRTLLQLEYTDKLLGELIDRLKREGIYDDALIALMSDHGESFAVKPTPAGPFVRGQLTFRRAVTMRNIEDIAGIAMFVKYPGQREGVVDDRFVRHTDLLPTILHSTGVARPPGLIGSDLLDPGYRGHTDVAVEKQDGSVVAMPVSRWKRRVAASKLRKLARFGQGDHSLFDFGPARTLHGAAVGDLRIEPRGRVRATVLQAGDLAHVNTGSGYLPAQVFGSIDGGRRTGRTLAFALNGTVVATAPSFDPPQGTHIAFSAMLPPDAFRRGANTLEIFQVLNGLHVRRLYG